MLAVPGITRPPPPLAARRQSSKTLMYPLPPRIIIAEDVTTVAGASKAWAVAETAQHRRRYPDRNHRRRLAQGMEGSTGPIWRINRMCPIKDEIQGLDESWLIVTVT